MNTFKHVAIAATVAALAGVAYYLCRDKIGNLFNQESEPEPPQKKKNNPEDAMKELGRAFLRYADNFQGLYEPMYKASIGAISFERMRNVLTEWDIRIGNIGNIPISLKSWWSTVWTDNGKISDEKLQERAQEVIRMISSSGIIRDDRTELTAEADTDRFYQPSSDEKWTEGQKLRVETPCWYIQTTPVRIIEKGYCIIIN